MIASLAKSILLGTERGEVVLPPLPESLLPLSEAMEGAGTEEKVLAAASVWSLYESAGLELGELSAAAPKAATPERDPYCSRRAAQLLERILKTHDVLLPEWLALAVAGGVCVPPVQLPSLLRTGHRLREMQQPIAKVAGKRGEWLGAQNKEWGYVLQASDADQKVWDEGCRGERVAFLTSLRGPEPERARELLAATWDAEDAKTRAELLAVFAFGLSAADEAFLEGCLADRSQQVRQVAVRLLGALVDSAWSQRASSRLAELVTVTAEATPKIEIEAPAEADEALAADGITDKWALGDGLGTRARLLGQLVAATPLEWWTSTSGLSIDALIGQVRKSTWRVAVLRGWLEATIGQRNGAWALVWLECGKMKDIHIDHDALLAVLSPEKRDAWRIERLKTRKSKALRSELMAIIDGEDMAWSPALSEAVLVALKKYVGMMSEHDWQLRKAVPQIALKVAVECLPHATLPFEDAKWTYLVERAAEYDDILTIRLEMHKEMS